MTMMDKVPRVFRLKPGRWWIVAEEYNVGEEDITYLELLLDAIRRVYGVKPSAQAHNVKQGELFFEMPWGYRVEVKSARYPHTLVSKGLDCATLSEAAKLDEIVWDKYISPALADRKAPCDFASTPEGDNWFKSLHDQGAGGPRERWLENVPEWVAKKYPAVPMGEKRLEAGADPQDSWESWNFPAWVNPIVYPKGFDDPEIKRQMKTEHGTSYFWQEIGASFTSLAGAVYPQWSRVTHVLPERWEYRPEWPNYAMWDFGFTNPTACLEVQIDPATGNWYAWREYYQSGESIFGHIATIKGRANPVGYAVACGFGDAADPEAVAEIAKNLYPCYADTRAKDFEVGIQECQALLKDVGGVAHMFVCPSLVHFPREIGSYKWPKVRTEPTKTIEKPMTTPNHLLDAWRYGVMHLKVLGGEYRLSQLMDRATLDAMTRAPTPVEPVADEPRTIFPLVRGIF